MLEGLEISEIKIESILNETRTFRLDSEYFLKDYLAIEHTIKSHPDKFIKFSDLHINTDCSAFYPALELYYNLGEYPFIRVGDVKDIVNYDNCIKIPEEILPDYPTLKKVDIGDIVLTKGGSIGIAGYVTQPACVSRDLIFINSSVLSESKRVLLYLYLSTTFAYKQFIRLSSQCAQPHLTTTLIKNFDIYDFTDEFANIILSKYIAFREKSEMSKQKYQEAEDILLSELGLKDWEPKNQTSTNKCFADFQESGRLDAEYYQPKYSDLFAHLKMYETKLLSQIVTIYKSIEPGSDAYQEGGIPFVRVSNLSKFGLTEPNIHLDKATYEIPKLKPKKDTILLSKDGSVGIAYKLEQDLDAITSGAILHLKITDNEFLPDYLTLVLNSIIVKMQAERDAGGSIIQHWKPSEIEQVIIPKLSQKLQMQIAEKIQESFALKAESKRLLDLAKTAVEIAIEQGEQKALELLKQN